MTSSKAAALLVVLLGLWLPAPSRAAGARAKPARLTAKQIVARHVAARGGLRAWHAVQSMAWNGKMEIGFGDSVARAERYVSNSMRRKGVGPRAPTPLVGNEAAAPAKQVQVPFLLELKRPAKSRVELEFGGKTAVQVYDGANGWLLRPYLNRDDWEPFTAEQASSQQGKWDLDGPLMDAAAQGTKVELVSMDKVEGRDAYELKLTHKGGEVQHVWIDAKTFLDVKVEGTPRRMDGKLRTVWVIQRDFRSVQGLKVPFVQETAVEGYSDTHKMTIDKVALNPRVDDARFQKPRA